MFLLSSFDTTPRGFDLIQDYTDQIYDALLLIDSSDSGRPYPDPGKYNRRTCEMFPVRYPSSYLLTRVSLVIRIAV
jgi:hypothetical protein